MDTATVPMWQGNKRSEYEGGGNGEHCASLRADVKLRQGRKIVSKLRGI